MPKANSLISSLVLLPESERRKAIQALSQKEANALLYDWEFWARPQQLPPPGDWLIWLIMTGRGWGKTRAAGEFVIREVKEGRAKRVALVAKTPADARDVMVEGESGILNISPPWFKPEYEPSKRRLTWPNGAIATVYSSKEPDHLNGPQHDLCFIAGTMISTPTGERAIEKLSIGDYVLTREGKREITCLMSRNSLVGSVKFSNGAVLTCTKQHPVLQLLGWTKAGELRKGAIVCTGEKLQTGILQPISVGKKSISIDGYGNRLMAQFQMALRYIIKTRIKRIIFPAICIWWQRNPIGQKMQELLNLLLFAVRIVAVRLEELLMLPTALQYVGAVNIKGLRINGKPIEYVKSVGNYSGQELPNEARGISVVSVVSIWEDAGQARVYNITVESPHEYIANGIIVHNCWGDEIRTWYSPQETWDMLMFGLRIGNRPRMVATTTPLPIALIKNLIKMPDVIVTQGTTYENRANLAPAFYSQIVQKYEGTRLGQQEIKAELLEDVPGALWSRSMIQYAEYIDDDK